MTNITQVVRKLRKEETLAEKRFWTIVRNRQINGMKFRRQYPISFEWDDQIKHFIADFYCHECKLVFEIDGGIHEQQKNYDILRTYIINQIGIKVIRFSNNEVSIYELNLNTLEHTQLDVDYEVIYENKVPFLLLGEPVNEEWLFLYSKHFSIIYKDSENSFFATIGHAIEFNNVGNRKSYRFNLEFLNGVVTNNISGSAVARDLVHILENSTKVSKLIQKGRFKFNLDGGFTFWITKLET